MKKMKRLCSAVLALALVLSLCGLPVSAAAEEAPAGKGSIGLTLRFDLPQTLAAVTARNIKLTVTAPDGGRTVVALPGGEVERNELGAYVTVVRRNTQGVPMTTEEAIGYCEATVADLPGGSTYTLGLQGEGYADYTQTVALEGYSKHVILGTGDKTFSLGDLNADGKVDRADLALMDGSLGGTDTRYDFNGDGRVDVVDLFYVNFLRGASGEAQVLETSAIVAAQVDTEGLVVDGDAQDLFREEGTVTIAPGEGKSDIEIPIVLDQDDGVEMSEIRISAPMGSGAINAGSADVELADGTTMMVDFDVRPPEDIHAIGEDEEQHVVTIDLGKKVAVKKVTIRVTETEDSTDYAVVTQIEFLKDIVPENPENDADRVKNVAAVPANESVALTWDAVRNVTGYTVYYGLTAGSMTQQVSTNTNSALVAGLENLKTYYFQIRAVNGDWQGKPSEVISAMPQPGSIPGAPSNISVTAADQALRVSWGKTKDADRYQPYYRVKGESEYIPFGSATAATSVTITGLVNGTTYEIAVKAGNQKGFGPYSSTAEGTPKREEIVMPDLPEDGRLDNSIVESVKLYNSNNVDRNLCPNFTPMDLVDGDAATYWVARAWWESSTITYTFTQPQDMNYALLVPYLGGNYKYAIKQYSVVATDENGEELASGSYPAARMDPEKNYLVIKFPMVQGVKQLSIALAEREGNGCRVSVSDMAFYQSDSLAEEIEGLFADGTFTSLRSGVDEAAIAQLSARLEAKADFYLDLARLRDELELASALLAGNSDALGLVKADFQSRSGAMDRAYGQSASDLQPLGVTARAGATLAVYAEVPDDAPVYVVPTQFFGESGIWRSSAIRLESGRNYIYVPKIGSLSDERGGMFYLTYAGANPEAIRVQVRGDQNVTAIPTLELSGWYDMSEDARTAAISAYVTELERYVTALGSANLATNTKNATEVSTPSVLLSIPADQALAGLRGVTGTTVEAMSETLYQNVLAWEDELYVANQVQGIIPAGSARDESYRYPMTTRQNIRYMRMFAGAFMYAAGNHVGVGYGSTAALMRGRPVSQTGVGSANALYGWGIAHEIGHNMDKLGRAEITNNIYSLAIQAWDGQAMKQNTRLTYSNKWAGVFAKTAAGRPGAANDVFVQLGMYWQLHLAYDGADTPLEFYNCFFSLLKSGEYAAGYTADERIALIAAKVADRDLTEFFTRWGMDLGEDARAILAGYPQESRAVWYLNDDSRIYRLSGGEVYAGTVSVSAQVEENVVTLTLTGEGNADALLGYEIRRNGRAIGFTTQDTYVDDLGAANNLTYRYSAVPVDRLGNTLEAVEADEIRIAYDKAIDPSLYDLTVEEGTAVFTMKNDKAVQVTGIKLTGAAAAGCTVSVKAGAEDETWTQVALGPENAGVCYFTKPGAEAGDTRLWTYDAAVVRVEGVPEGASVELLDYPGDRIDFYEGAAVGILRDDYRYGEGADDVIAAGTLVILGTYRGDPVYNTVQIEAIYNTTAEAAEENGTTVTEARAVNGYALLFAEIPADGAVSDTSDGFWIFVPDLAAEKELNAAAGVTDDYPLEIRAVLFRTDVPDDFTSHRTTSQTLWISFPEASGVVDPDTGAVLEETLLPIIILTGSANG